MGQSRLIQANSTLNTYHSFVLNLPLALPVKAVLDSAFLEYLKLLQLIGNSALDFSKFDLSTMQMSQQPKIGPLSGLQAIANWAKLSPYLSLKSIEKINEVCDLSGAQCFLLEFQGRGVQPPITFPYSVSITVSVLGTSSQDLWNSATEKPLSLALYIKVNLFMGCLNIDRRKSVQNLILSILLSMAMKSGAVVTDEEKVDNFYPVSFPSIWYKSWTLFNNSSICL